MVLGSELLSVTPRWRAHDDRHALIEELAHRESPGSADDGLDEVDFTLGHRQVFGEDRRILPSDGQDGPALVPKQRNRIFESRAGEDELPLLVDLIEVERGEHPAHGGDVEFGQGGRDTIAGEDGLKCQGVVFPQECLGSPCGARSGLEDSEIDRQKRSILADTRIGNSGRLRLIAHGFLHMLCHCQLSSFRPMSHQHTRAFDSPYEDCQRKR